MSFRSTKQKALLEDILPSLQNFFSAEALHNKALESNSKIGIATVYRFLNSKVESGDLFTYQCGGKSVFSAKRSHCHFVDVETDKVVHVELKSLDFLKDLDIGVISSVDIEIKGSLNKK